MKNKKGKRNIVIIIISIIVLLIFASGAVIFNKYNKYLKYKETNQYQIDLVTNMIKDYLNGKYNKGINNNRIIIDEKTIASNDYFMSFPHEHDISELISILITKLTNTYKYYINPNPSKRELDKDYVYNYNYYSSDNPNLQLSILRRRIRYNEFFVNEYFETHHVDKKMDASDFRKDFINKLEECIEHRSEKYDEGWYIKEKKAGLINLPYDFYIYFPVFSVEKLYEIKDVLKVEFPDNIIYDKDNYSYYTINPEDNSKEQLYNIPLTITYRDYNNEVKTKNDYSVNNYREKNEDGEITSKIEVSFNGIKYNLIEPLYIFEEDPFYAYNTWINHYYSRYSEKIWKVKKEVEGTVALIKSGNYMTKNEWGFDWFVDDPVVQERMIDYYINEDLPKEIKKANDYNNSLKEIAELMVLKRGEDY